MREKRVRSTDGVSGCIYTGKIFKLEILGNGISSRRVIMPLFFNLGVQWSPSEIRLSVDNSMSGFGHYI